MRLLRALYSILIRCRLDVNLEVDFSVVSTTNESKSLKLFILSDLFAYLRKKLYLCKPKEKHNACNQTKTHTTLCFRPLFEKSDTAVLY